MQGTRFKTTRRMATATFELCAAGSVLIGSGRNNEVDVRLPDTTFLSGNDGKETAYVIPGSTIKGVIRDYIYHNHSKLDETELFGGISPAKKSKLSFYDAYADMSTVVTNVRYQTKIEPVTQGAQKGTLRNVQTVDQGVFKASMKLVNYTEEELLAVVSALDAIDKGILRLGASSSRGFGKMKIGSFNMTVTGGFDEELNPKVIKTYTDFDELRKEVRQGEL